MKVIITCGGTGGHITPALAIADIIRQTAPRAEILFVGAKGGMEEELVTAAGYPIRSLRVRGLVRRLTSENLGVLRDARLAAKEAEHLIGEFQPDIVIGTGGYASYPTLAAAVRLGVPSAVHESNAVAGLAVKRLAPKVDRVWLNFYAAGKGLSRRAHVLTVGNPVRQIPFATQLALPQGCRQMLLSFGGSLGAAAINQGALELAERLADRPDIYYLHVSGKRDFESMRAEYAARGFHKKKHLALFPFITDMPRRMAAADLVISRAGAITISELASTRRAAILIPSPNVTGNHQYKNARVLADAGAAVLLPEAALEEGVLSRTVLALLADEEKRNALSHAIGAFATPDASERIWRDIGLLLKKGK